MEIKYNVTSTDPYLTIKQLLKEKYEMSDRLILKLKTSRRIFLNNSSVYVTAPLHTNDFIQINLDFYEDNSNIEPVNIPLDIIYEDEYYLVVNKPAGIAVHPSMQHYNNSLSNGVKYYFDTINLYKKIRPVNRLDKDTSRFSDIRKK